MQIGDKVIVLNYTKHDVALWLRGEKGKVIGIKQTPIGTLYRLKIAKVTHINYLFREQYLMPIGNS